ncbi:hypothetical protein NKR19_g5834 [Coniochaeta hoffmannii]|uniref:Uncharacterized protein n=1 Tax=Coniochaeta hoffmannii TaxID=91930 RepID=A0AA38RFF1_9PEZI|nr:hypothetical protein NKR19_g5834 [Coniochaeta hoffmannii]
MPGLRNERNQPRHVRVRIRLAPQRSAVETKPPSFGELGPDASQVITTGITTPDRTRLPRQGGRMLGNYEQSITYFELLQPYFSKYGAQMGLALEPGHSPDNNHSGAAVKARDGQDGHLTREQDPALRRRSNKILAVVKRSTQHICFP